MVVADLTDDCADRGRKLLAMLNSWTQEMPIAVKTGRGIRDIEFWRLLHRDLQRKMNFSSTSKAEDLQKQSVMKTNVELSSLKPLQPWSNFFPCILHPLRPTWMYVMLWCLICKQSESGRQMPRMRVARLVRTQMPWTLAKLGQGWKR